MKILLLLITLSFTSCEEPESKTPTFQDYRVFPPVEFELPTKLPKPAPTPIPKPTPKPIIV